ncbi:Homeobox protein Wariai, partial [Diplonema papillatum]
MPSPPVTTGGSKTGESIALFAACRHGHLEEARGAISAGANVNYRGGMFGERPLHVAAARGDLAVVKLLLLNGANVNATCERKSSPLHEAVLSNALPVVLALCVAGANMSAKNRMGATPAQLGRQKRQLDGTQSRIAAEISKYLKSRGSYTVDASILYEKHAGLHADIMTADRSLRGGGAPTLYSEESSPLSSSRATAPRGLERHGSSPSPNRWAPPPADRQLSQSVGNLTAASNSAAGGGGAASPARRPVPRGKAAPAAAPPKKSARQRAEAFANWYNGLRDDTGSVSWAALQ